MSQSNINRNVTSAIHCSENVAINRIIDHGGVTDENSRDDLAMLESGKRPVLLGWVVMYPTVGGAATECRQDCTVVVAVVVLVLQACPDRFFAKVVICSFASALDVAAPRHRESFSSTGIPKTVIEFGDAD